MPKRSRKNAKPAKQKKAEPKRDENQMAHDLLQQIIKQSDGTDKNPLAVALGRMGGLKGGRARAAALTQGERTASAAKAANARWASKQKTN